MNISTIRSLVRQDLRDTNPNTYRWSDQTLDRHIARAVAEYSAAVPRQMTMNFITTYGCRDIDLTPIIDRVCVMAAEYPAGENPRRYRRFSVWAHRLTLEGGPAPDGSELTVYYGAIHIINAETSTLPVKHHDLVATGAAAYAAIEWAAFAVNRVNNGADAAGGYFRWGKERLSTFRDELRRLSRRSSLRVSRLYPATESVTEYVLFDEPC
ncbi:hypothetical protein DGWBC_0332 [Dehalogenimonas sp. WBC-2]|nr:hypothetical protein DGWBC_0332 [Dehalogenimonas sp. WBC-2]